MSTNSAPVPVLQLTELDAAANPIDQFRAWFRDAEGVGFKHAEAMTLATATPDGKPSARVVLLRGFDERGFAFFTNYQSRKAAELADNPRAALVFYWDALDRQVRVEGRIEKVSAEESDAYFGTRPIGHQISAWASPQSQVVVSRELLEMRMQELEAQYGDQVPRPPHWGGYRLIPEMLEFWQGRISRLHDRLRYRKKADGSWVRERLAP